MSLFQKATKHQSKLRLALQGPAGSGKTWSALSIARHLGEKIAVVDTEYGSASKYSDEFDFDVMELRDDFNPARVGECIKGASGYDVLVIDSMTMFWNGPGGFLALVDEEVKKQRARGSKGDSFAAWKDIDPQYKRMVHAILAAPMHVIVTLRAKTAYERTEDERGKARIQKLGLAPEIRDTFQYEMDIEGMLDMEHNLVIGKTRCAALDGRVFHKPGQDVAEVLRTWLTTGAPAPAPKLTQEQRLALVERVKQVTEPTAFVGWLRAQYGFGGTGDITADKLDEITAHLDEMARVQREQAA